MFKSIKRSESFISVDLDEPLTGHACSQLIIELIKYVMYQKQQIPFSCDTLTKLHANSKPTDRNFSSMQHLINSLCNVSDHLASQFTIDGCNINEIVIIIGATIVSPKLSIRFELPNNILCSNTHLDYQHSHRKAMLSILRSFLECTEFQDEMTVPVGLTNTFVLVHKKDPRKTSEFFIPKPQFDVTSQNTRSFHIKLNYDESKMCSCNCKNLVKVFDDFSNEPNKEENGLEKSDNYSSQIGYQWYQSKEVFKGFKFLR